jgi:hypothetical protein
MIKVKKPRPKIKSLKMIYLKALIKKRKRKKRKNKFWLRKLQF